MRKDRKLCQVRKADVTLPLESSREERQPSKPCKNKTRYTYRGTVTAGDQHMLGSQQAQEAPGERAFGACYRTTERLEGGRSQVLRIASGKALRQEKEHRDHGARERTRGSKVPGAVRLYPRILNAGEGRRVTHRPPVGLA